MAQLQDLTKSAKRNVYGIGEKYAHGKEEGKILLNVSCWVIS